MADTSIYSTDIVLYSIQYSDIVLMQYRSIKKTITLLVINHWYWYKMNGVLGHDSAF